MKNQKVTSPMRMTIDFMIMFLAWTIVLGIPVGWINNILVTLLKKNVILSSIAQIVLLTIIYLFFTHKAITSTLKKYTVFKEHIWNVLRNIAVVGFMIIGMTAYVRLAQIDKMQTSIRNLSSTYLRTPSEEEKTELSKQLYFTYGILVIIEVVVLSGMLFIVKKNISKYAVIE